jgi:hypothetical protein
MCQQSLHAAPSAPPARRTGAGPCGWAQLRGDGSTNGNPNTVHGLAVTYGLDAPTPRQPANELRSQWSKTDRQQKPRAALWRN